MLIAVEHHWLAGWGSGDTTPPLLNIVMGPTRTRISRVVGMDASTFGFSSGEDFVAYQVRLVPGSTSPVTAGALIESGTTGTAGVAVSVTVTDDEMVAASAIEGGNIVKVFGQDAAGNWSI